MSTVAADAAEPPADPPSPQLVFLLMAVGRRVRARVDSSLGEHGLTYRHLSALAHLASDPNLSYSDLARRDGVTTQSMQATLAQLRGRGAVEQRNEARRGLRAQLRVTDTGAALLRRSVTTIDGLDHDLSAVLGEEQQQTVKAALLELFLSMRH